MMKFSFRTREVNLARMERETFDLLVIGGGITGAGIAQDAALRGLRTVLVEKGDFASGTSSKSSKMIHGGLRYLKEMQFSVTRAMIRERNLLVRLASPLVRWFPFMIPNYPWTPSHSVAFGLWLYDAIARLKAGRSHRTITSAEALRLAPALRQEGLHNAGIFWDCLTDDCRLVMTVIKSAAENGACIANYIEVIRFLRNGNRICGAVVQDALTGRQFELQATCVVNAGGTWMDRLRTIDDPECPPAEMHSKGVHIVIPQSRLPLQVAILFYSPDDLRTLFAIPTDTLVMLGTTDTPYNEDLDSPVATPADRDYILKAANRTFGVQLTLSDLISAFAGVRPLLKEDREFATDISRRHKIYVGHSGLISIGGGKLTTYRHIAREVTDLVARRLGKAGRCVTGRTSLLSYDPSILSGWPLDEDVQVHLERAYGTRCRDLLDRNQDKSTLERIVSDLPYLYAEVEYCVRHEMTITLADFICRRTRIVWQDKDHGLECVTRIAALMKSELAWTEEETRKQVEQFRKEVRLYLPPG